MSDAVKIWIFKDEVRAQVLKSPEMQAILREKAEEIAQRAGDGYEVKEKSGKNRNIAKIYTATFRAKADNAKNNTLLRALK